jgi:hypothetical protein
MYNLIKIVNVKKRKISGLFNSIFYVGKNSGKEIIFYAI